MRHGEATGHPEQPLTPSSREIVEKNAQLLGELGISVILTSPVDRAAVTAEIVGNALNLEPIQCRQLESWGFSKIIIQDLPQELAEIARQLSDKETSGPILAITHAPFIQANLNLDYEPKKGQHYLYTDSSIQLVS